MMAEVELNHPNRSNREINASAVLLMQLCVRLQFLVVKYVKASKDPTFSYMAVLHFCSNPQMWNCLGRRMQDFVKALTSSSL